MSDPSPTCHKLRLESSSRGRALVVGDIHGKFDMFMRLLALANYDSVVDIVYSLGDVIDRGPESQRTLEWFVGRRGAFLLLGNHEALMMQSAEDSDASRIWVRNGGEWGRRLEAGEKFLYTCMPRTLPLTAEISYDADSCRPVRGVDLLICGHTVIDDFEPRGLGNVLWIETGAAYGGRLTAVDPLKQVYWQVGQRDTQAWGPLPLPRLDPVSRAYRPTRAEKAEVEATEAEWRK